MGRYGETLAFQQLRKHLAKDYPEYLDIVMDVKSEVEKFNTRMERKVIESLAVTLYNSPSDDTKKERSALMTALNAKLEATHQKALNILQSMDVGQYDTVCDCCPQ